MHDILCWLIYFSLITIYIILISELQHFLKLKFLGKIIGDWFFEVIGLVAKTWKARCNLKNLTFHRLFTCLKPPEEPGVLMSGNPCIFRNALRVFFTKHQSVMVTTVHGCLTQSIIFGKVPIWEFFVWNVIDLWKNWVETNYIVITINIFASLWSWPIHKFHGSLHELYGYISWDAPHEIVTVASKGCLDSRDPLLHM